MLERESCDPALPVELMIAAPQVPARRPRRTVNIRPLRGRS
jgi:hypothetical protein